MTELLLALPTLYGRGDVLDRAEALVKNARSEAALANLAEVYRLLRAYGLADAVLLDLGEVRGFDYYSGVHFEAYVSGLGAPLVGGGRYDQMLGRFGYECPATGFAFEIGPGAARHGVAGRGAGAARARTSSSSTSRPTRPRALALCPAAAGPRRGGGARHHQPRGSRTRWPTRASSARAGRWSIGGPGRPPGRGAGAGSASGGGGAHQSRWPSSSPSPGAHFPGLGGRGMPNIVVVGAQWGDEGKGKIVDVLAPHVDVVVRYQGGNNAGHTVVVGREKFVLQSHALRHPPPGRAAA